MELISLINFTEQDYQLILEKFDNFFLKEGVKEIIEQDLNILDVKEISDIIFLIQQISKKLPKKKFFLLLSYLTKDESLSNFALDFLISKL